MQISSICQPWMTWQAISALICFQISISPTAEQNGESIRDQTAGASKNIGITSTLWWGLVCFMCWNTAQLSWLFDTDAFYKTSLLHVLKAEVYYYILLLYIFIYRQWTYVHRSPTISTPAHCVNVALNRHQHEKKIKSPLDHQVLEHTVHLRLLRMGKCHRRPVRVPTTTPCSIHY